MINRILVGYDGSDSARKALLTAFELAECLKGKVTLLVVVRPMEFVEFEVKTALDAAKKHLADTFHWAEDEALKRHTDLEIRSEVGHPAEIIAKIAEEEQFDLILIGRRGITKVKRWILGSISERVLRYAHCPVMVVD